MYLVLGDMKELGPRSAELHAECGQYARTAGVTRLYGLGEFSRHAVQAFGAEGAHYATPEELLHVLTAKSLTSTAPEIHLDCETTQFRYIIDRLEPYFTNLKPSTIDKAGIFYSKKNTRINKQNLYSNKIQNPKNQHNIDDILKELQ